jgi:hypothetical protein
VAAKKSVSLHKTGAPKPQSADKAVDGRVSVPHGAYLIVAGRRGEACAAVAYLGKKRIEETAGGTVDDAVQAARAALDARSSALRAQRTGEVPTESEFREMLGALYPELSKRMTAVLAAHCRQPGAAASMKDLARRFDVSENTIKLGYGRLARRLSSLLDFTPALEGLDRGLVPLLSLAEIEPTAKTDRSVLRLRPELVAALRSMQQTSA